MLTILRSKHIWTVMEDCQTGEDKMHRLTLFRNKFYIEQFITVQENEINDLEEQKNRVLWKDSCNIKRQQRFHWVYQHLSPFNAPSQSSNLNTLLRSMTTSLSVARGKRTKDTSKRIPNIFQKVVAYGLWAVTRGWARFFGYGTSQGPHGAHEQKSQCKGDGWLETHDGWLGYDVHQLDSRTVWKNTTYC